MCMVNVKQFGSFARLEAWPKIFLWDAFCIYYFCMDCWTVSLIAVLMINLWSACFVFLWWFFILKNFLEAVCKCNLFCIAKSVSYKSEWKSTSKYHLTSKNNHFSLVCIKGQWSFVKASIFISKIPLIPRWKSCPNPLHIFAKLQISLEHSKMMVFRQAWILNFRWNRSPKRGHGFSLSGANWLKADLGIVMLL